MAATTRVRRTRGTFFPRECLHDNSEATHAVERRDPDGVWRVESYVCDFDAQRAVQRGAVIADRRQAVTA